MSRAIQQNDIFMRSRVISTYEPSFKAELATEGNL